MTNLLAYNATKLITTVDGFTEQALWYYLPIVSESGLGKML